jgi:6,7-dimethyl-8-ribityllumazine synthase
MRFTASVRRGTPLSRQVRKIQGSRSARGLKFGIVVSRFNEALTRELLDNALKALKARGAILKNIYVVHVPGAFELPLAAKKLIQKVRLDAVITLGVVIRGRTRHFEQVAQEAARGVRELSEKSQVPVILGIIPAENVSQAVERVKAGGLNKGREWALAAIEMATLVRKLS